MKTAKRVLMIATCGLMFVNAANAAQAVTPASGQNLARMFFTQVIPCWKPPEPANGGIATVVRLEIHLGTDGRLIGDVELLSKFDTIDPRIEEAIMRAKAAIYACGPYKLPPEQYQSWRNIVVTFDPRML